MTGFSDIKTQNFVKIFTLGNFEDKLYKPKVATLCIALFIRVTEGLNQTCDSSANKRSFLLKNELSKLPLFYRENSHFFYRKTILETPTNFPSKFKVGFPVSEVYFFIGKER